MDRNKVVITLGLILAALLFLIWVITPFAHDFVWTVTGDPVGILAFIVLLIGGIASIFGGAYTWSVTSDSSNKSYSGVMIAGCFMFGIALIGVYILYGVYAVDTYGTALARSFEPQPVTLGQVGNTTNPRWLAFDIAQTTAKAQQNDSRRILGDIDTNYTPEGVFWVGPRQPNGFPNTAVSGNVDAIAMVNDVGQSVYQPASFACAENGFMSNAIWWKLYEANYWGSYPEVFYWKSPVDGQWLIVAPILGREFIFPVYIPSWGGVVVLDKNCDAQVLPPAAASADPRLAGAQIFPSDLAYDRATNWGFRFGGLPNIWWTHLEQVEINDLPNSKNGQPYLIDTPTFGRVWVVAAEPYGDSQAIFKMFLFSASTEQSWVVNFDQNQPANGPKASASVAQSGTPGYSWYETIGTGENKTTAGSYVILEPRPIIKDGQLYWLYSVSTTNYSGTAVGVLVNASRTEEVLHFCSRANLVGWVNGQGGSDQIPCSNTAAATSTEPSQPVSRSSAPVDSLESMSDDELWALINRAMQILQSRGK